MLRRSLLRPRRLLVPPPPPALRPSSTCSSLPYLQQCLSLHTYTYTYPDRRRKIRSRHHPQPRRTFRLSPSDFLLDDDGKKSNSTTITSTPPQPPPVSLQELSKLLLRQKETFGTAIAGIGIASFCQICVPTIFGNVIDMLSTSLSTAGAGAGPPPSSLSWTFQENAAAMLGIAVAGTGATYLSHSRLDMAGSRISMDLRKRLFGNLMEQDLAFFDVNKSGELANRLSTDVHEVAEHLVVNLSLFLSSGVMAVGSSAMLIYISPSLSAVTLCVVPAMVLGATQYAKVVKRLSRELLDALAASTQTAAERLGAIRIVRHFTAEDREKARYAHIIDQSLGISKRLAVSEGVYVAAIYGVSNFALLGVLFLGAGMVLDGGLTVGALASYCLYSNHLSESIKDATDAVAGIIKAQGAAGRLYSLLHTQPTLPRGTLIPPPDTIHGGVEFQDVSFAYPTRRQSLILNHFSLKCHPRENLGVTGPSGCGKSSLALLLTRMYAPHTGKVLLDGYDIATLDPTFLRRTVVVITQEPLLFSGTVRENIAYGYPEATEEEITEAAALANAEGFISRLPQGYDTQIGERALALSGGQKQRLSVARALLLRPKVLILDEATASLDSSNQREILQHLITRCHASTVIIIGHSSTALEGSTRLITLNKKGEIARDEVVGEAELPCVLPQNGGAAGHCV